ncbi:hypothetical protein DPMN_054618 [Dreissena polymorpha]|uniref:Uncharacterized protein n=1 Tax=Dreissena polymorpha TaxID=45954 RepID=A0A9D4CNG0_DREPO|nr:hypothetical protein DPMN_054618 [Dreissena polymorpha]
MLGIRSLLRLSEEKAGGQIKGVDIPSQVPMDELLLAAHNKPDWIWISVSLSHIPPTARPVSAKNLSRFFMP